MMDGGGRGGNGGADVMMAGAPGVTPPGATPPGVTPPGATRPLRTTRPRPPAPAPARAGGDDVVAVVVVVVPGGRLRFFLHSTPWYHSGGPLFLGVSLQEKIAK